MLVTAQRKAEVQRWMAEWIGGPDYDGEIERRRAGRFPDIPRASFYRWWRLAKVKAAKSGAVAAQAAAKVLAAEERRQIKKAQRDSAKAEVWNGIQQVAKGFPTVVTPDSILPVPKASTLDLIRTCIRNAEDVMAFCHAPEGQLRNPKLLIQASNHLLACVATQARVAELLYDAQRIEQFLENVVTEVSRADAQVGMRVLDRLKALQNRWGT